jgi:hypothetical protein
MTREVDQLIVYGLAAKTGCRVTEINTPGEHTPDGITTRSEPQGLPARSAGQSTTKIQRTAIVEKLRVDLINLRNLEVVHD